MPEDVAKYTWITTCPYVHMCVFIRGASTKLSSRRIIFLHEFEKKRWSKLGLSLQVLICVGINSKIFLLKENWEKISFLCRLGSKIFDELVVFEQDPSGENLIPTQPRHCKQNKLLRNSSKI